MSYEKSPVAENTSAIPHQPPEILREPREIEPYRADPYRKKLPKDPLEAKAPGTGQPDIGSETKVVPEETQGSTEEPATLRLSPQMAALYRKEQKFRRDQAELGAEKQALEAEKKELEELRALRTKLQAKDFSGIESQVPYDDYTKYLIEKEGKLSPEQQELKTLKDEIEGIKKSQQDDVTKRFEAAVNERRKAITQLVAGSEEFTTIKELKAEEHVLQHVLDTWEHDNIDLTPEEAAQEVEKELLERANKWSSLSKLKPKEPETDEKKQLPPLKPAIKTLTNNMAATGEIKRPAKSFQHMSDTERYAEARRRAEEKLRQEGKLK